MGCYSQKSPDFPHSDDTWRTKIIQHAEAKEAMLDQWLNSKSHAPQQIGDGAHSFPSRWVGEILRLGFAVEGSQPCSNRDQIRRGEESLRLQLYQLAMRHRTPLPLAFLWVGMSGGAGNTSHAGMVSPKQSLGISSTRR